MTEASTGGPAGAGGPAEAVRRALRAAREREDGAAPASAQAPAPAEPSEVPGDLPREEAAPAESGTGRPEGAPSRPGDAARAALRRAADAPRAREEAPRTDVPPAADVPPDPHGPRGGPGARPGDVAREALRAARAQARLTPPGTGEPGDGTSARRAARPAAAPAANPGAAASAGRPGGRAAEARARDVRTFAEDAFRMPSETDPAAAAEAPGPTGSASGESGSPHPGPDPARRPVTAPGPAPRPVAAPGPAPRSSASPAPTPAPAPATPAPTAGPAPATSVPAAHGPAVPRSMAAPGRDGEHRRTFAAFPPRPAGEGGGFAGTWWGDAWITALEEGALDAERLARGRGYAERGHVDAITVTPGLVLAYVRGGRARPYRVQVRLRTLGDEDWERFLDAAVERPGHIAALLDKEMPESLADCGVPLLPGPGDLAPQCSCPDHGHPCKHVAALCYQTARLLDADPFVLLLLRGRGERELLDTLSRRNAARAARAAQEQEPEPVPGVRATDALAARRLPPLPAPLPPPAHPGQPPAYPAVPDGPDSFVLDQLATDAALRAHALLTTGHDEIGGLTLWQDAVRLAAARPGSGLTATSRTLYASLASAAGRTPGELARAVAAWRQGGPDGLAVLEDLWDPPAGRFDRARPLLRAADLPAFRPWRNHLTHPHGHVQLRLGRDGLWYPYESEPGRDDWWPRGTPDIDPVGALTGLATWADEL
ncbi:SWIM zinc finger family protein [Streptomyces sp. NPDC014882]|uniref:SWIM zinc finger family protein n=1 Tax=Streptomyces sp. NPDC014882 TaxID=3364927 RepID=UPI0036FB43ED